MKPVDFYAAKAKGGDAYAAACTEAIASGYIIREDHLIETGKVKNSAPAPDPRSPDLVKMLKGDAKGVVPPKKVD